MSNKRETYGHTNIYLDGTTCNKPIKEKTFVLHYSFTENDADRFIVRGPETEIHIGFDETWDKSKLIEFLEGIDMDRTVLREIKKLHEKGEFRSGDHKIE